MLLYVKEFKNYLDGVCKVIKKKNVIPILGYVCFKNQVMYATDLDILVGIHIPLLDKDFKTCINYVEFKEFIDRLAKNKDVTFVMELVGDKVVINNEYALDTLSSEDYPFLFTDKSDSVTDYVCNDFIENIVKLIPMMQNTKSKEPRHYLNGIYFNGIDMVSTDGHRLGKINIDLKECTGVIIPEKTCKILSRIKTKDIIKLQASTLKITVYCDNITITSKLIDGHYPYYNEVFPKTISHVIATHKNELLDILENCRKEGEFKVHDDGKFKYTSIYLNFLKDKINVINGSDVFGFVESDSSQDIDIRCYNLNYLISILKSMNTNSLYISLSEGFSPVILSPYINDFEQYLLMPIRFK